MRQRLASQTGFVGELSEGKYYRVISYYGRALIDTEAVGGDMSTQPIDANDISQYWTLIKDGDKWKFENVLTQRLLLKHHDKGECNEVQSFCLKCGDAAAG